MTRAAVKYSLETEAITMANKTLTAPVLTAPVITDAVFAGTVMDSTFIITDNTTPSKALKFELSGISSSTTRTLTVPDADDTLSLLGTAQTITGAKTFGSAGAVGKLKIAGTTSGSTILDATAIASGTLTLPAATDTLVGLATADNLTNKTLTAPVLSGSVTGTYTLAGTPTIASPTLTGTVHAGAVSANAGNCQTIVGAKATLGNASATSFIRVTSPNVTGGAFIHLTAVGTLGDGDSSHTVSYSVAISRITDADTKAVASAAGHSVKTTGAGADATTAVSVTAMTGAAGAAQTFDLQITVTRSAGASDNHNAAFNVSMIQATDGGWTLATV